MKKPFSPNTTLKFRTNIAKVLSSVRRLRMANKESSVSNPMMGGDGPTSYVQNSTHQRAVLVASTGFMHESIMDKLDFNSQNFHLSNKFLIADYGCSTGPNTFIATQTIVEAIKLKYQEQCPSNSPLEFQVYFSDHVGNDFNTLFKSLPPSRDYLAAGVPGSFHKQLLSSNFLHVVNCSYSLHWISRIPKKVEDSSSLAWNKNSIQCDGLNKEVTKAFLAQFQNDLDNFLSARGKEIVPNGLLIILIPSLPEGVLLSETATGMMIEYLGSSLMDLANMGIIAKEAVHAFNIPIFYPTGEELKHIINKNGYFEIEKMERLDNLEEGFKSCPHVVFQGVRAVFEGLLKQHFGDETVMDKIFEHYSKKLLDNFYNIESSTKNRSDHFILLKRNIDR